MLASSILYFVGGLKAALWGKHDNNIYLTISSKYYYSKPFSDGFWDIEMVVKKCPWKYYSGMKGEVEDLLYQDIKALKEIYSKRYV